MKLEYFVMMICVGVCVCQVGCQNNRHPTVVMAETSDRSYIWDDVMLSSNKAVVIYDVFLSRYSFVCENEKLETTNENKIIGVLKTHGLTNIMVVCTEKMMRQSRDEIAKKFEIQGVHVRNVVIPRSNVPPKITAIPQEDKEKAETPQFTSPHGRDEK